MDTSRRLTTDSLQQSFGEEDDDVSVIAVIQVDKDVPPKSVNPPQIPTSTVQGAVQVNRSEGPEVILLDQGPVGQSCQGGETQHVNRRVIDLSDKKSKMALREQLRLESPTAERSDEDGIADYGGMDILQKLPSDTVVIKRDARMQKEDSDYVRDSTETNSSGGSSSTSGYAAGKVKRIHRVMRSKNRNTVEVRRNPMRVTKNTEKETSRSRQRLLSAKRKEAQAAPESKRVKLSTMPYMNTRSVTRKMYTVGAIYQAPTIKDMKEWKEWPVHGMHERPVFHPQVGLATEFMGRYFISLDGLSYREIVDHPGANTIAPDPYFNFSRPNRSCQEKRVTLKVRNSTSKKASQDTSKEDKSFAGYMHRSLHYVLAYCAQVMTPAYRKNVRDKIRILQRDGTLPLSTNESEQPNFKESKGGELKRLGCEQNTTTTTVVSEQKRVQEQKQLDNCTVTMPQSAIELNQQEKAIRQPQTSMVYLADPQKNLISLKNLRTIRGGQLIFQDVRPIQKNSLVFVKAAGVQSASHSREQVCKTVSRDLNFTKLEDTAISDEALMEMSSVYTNFAPTDNAISSHSSSMSFPRRVAPKIAAKPENLTVPKRVVIDRPYGRREKENQLRVGNYNVKNIGRLSETSTSSNTGTTWYTNDASEIAKILSEYNRSIARKSAVQNTFHVSPTNVQKPNLLRTSQRLGRLELQGNDELQGCSGQSFGLANQTAIKLSQDKWRRFYPTVEIMNEPTVSYKVGVQSGSVPTENALVNSRNINQETITRYTKVDNNFCSSLSSSQQRQSFMKNIKPNLDKRECEKDTQKDAEKSAEMDALQELLEDTAMLYCAATGTHQDDLANYIDSLDAKQSIQWLEMVDPAWS